MEQKHIDRLTKLAEHLETGQLAHEHFDFSVFNNVDEACCGTAGCAIGELPAIWPERFAWAANPEPKALFGIVIDNKDPDRWWKTGLLFFGIEAGEWEHLFLPYEQWPELYGGSDLGHSATRYEVAANIRAFIDIKQKELIHPQFPVDGSI